MLSKILSAVKLGDDKDVQQNELISPRQWNPPALAADQIRVIVFQDSNKRGKVLLYDSSLSDTGLIGEKGGRRAQGSSEKTPLPNGKKLSRSDVEMLGEMMFGAIPLAHKHTSTKVHFIRSSPQIVVSKLFSIRSKDISAYYKNGKGNQAKRSAVDDTDYTVNKSWSNLTESSFELVSDASKDESMDASIKGKGTESSAQKGNSPPQTPPRSPNNSPRPSVVERIYRQKRLSRSKHTSIEYGHFRRLESDDTDEMPSRFKQRRPMYAIGILFNLTSASGGGEKNRVLQEFFFSHYTLIEFHIQKLYSSLITAILQTLTKSSSQTKSVGRCSKLEYIYSPKQSMNERGLQNNVVFMKAILQFRAEIHWLYSAPRVQEPVWLNMVTFSHLRKCICRKFMGQFVSLINDFDREDTSFFLSNLLSAVLAHHLAWVPTVAPTTDKKAEHLSKQASQCLELQARFFPYNPLWAQLGDVYGCIGSPVSLSRTIVVGRRADIVCRFLYILTYFIRCSEVFENIEQNKEIADRTEEALVVGSSGPIHNPALDKVAEDPNESESVLSMGATSSCPSSRSQTHKSGWDKDESITALGEGDKKGKNAAVSAEDEGVGSPKAMTHEPASAEVDGATATSPGRDTAVGDAYGPFSDLDPFDKLIEIPMPRSIHLRVVPDAKKAAMSGNTSRPPYAADKLYSKNFGRSLMGGYFNHYLSDFALSGVPKNDFMPELAADLKLSVELSVLEEPVKKSNCIIADTDKWLVNIASAEGKKCATVEGDPNCGLSVVKNEPASFVRDLLSAVKGMCKLGLPQETCLMFVEDKLQELYHKSKLVASFVAEQNASSVPADDVVSALGVHRSDMPLLIAIAGTHFPGISERICYNERASTSISSASSKGMASISHSRY